MASVSEVFQIEDIEVFEALDSAFRQRIMRNLATPGSVKELAEQMDVPVTRLYYHVNLLADAGVIRVVEERKVGAIIEKVYQTTARSYAPGPGLLSAGHDPADLARVAAGVVIDHARADAEAALTYHFATGDTFENLPGAIGRGHARLTRERAKEFADRLGELLEEMQSSSEDEDSEEYALSIVFFPTSVSL